MTKPQQIVFWRLFCSALHILIFGCILSCTDRDVSDNHLTDTRSVSQKATVALTAMTEPLQFQWSSPSATNKTDDKSWSDIEVSEVSYEVWTDATQRRALLRRLAKAWAKGRAVALPIIHHDMENKQSVHIGKISAALTKAMRWNTKEQLYWVIKPVAGHPTRIDFRIAPLPMQGGTLEASSIAVDGFEFGKLLYPPIFEQSATQHCAAKVQYFLAEFNRTRKRIYAKNAKKIGNIRAHRFDIANNCREPGSIEIALKGQSPQGTTQTLLKGYVHLPQSVYDPLVQAWTGVNIKTAGIHQRRLLTVDATNEHRYVGYSESKAASPNKITECTIDDVHALLRASGYRPTSEGKSHDGAGQVDVSFAKGIIPFKDLPKETQKKSAWRHPERNSYLFIRLDEQRPPRSFLSRGKNRTAGKVKYELPVGFLKSDGSHHMTSESPLARATSGYQFWSLSRTYFPEGIFVPHRFARYDEMLSQYGHRGYYQRTDIESIKPSAFEVDGRYGAELDIQSYNSARLWPIDIRSLPKMTSAKAIVYRQGKKTLTDLELSCQSECLGKFSQIHIANVSLKPGQRREILLGIGVEPLEIDYNAERISEQKLPVYAFTTNEEGKIIDHNPEVGKVVVTRGMKLGDQKHPSTYTVDIITDDRIHPLARYRIKLKQAKIAARPPQ